MVAHIVTRSLPLLASVGLAQTAPSWAGSVLVPDSLPGKADMTKVSPVVLADTVAGMVADKGDRAGMIALLAATKVL